MPTDDVRWYRQRWTALGVRVAAWVGLAAAALVVYGWRAHGDPAGPVAVILAVAVIACVVWATRSAGRQGVHETPAGLKLVSMTRSRSIPWADIEGFEHRRNGTLNQVFVKGTDSGWRLLPGVLQGQRVIWDGDETRDIVAVLNDRWREHRRASDEATVNRAPLA